jgi:hypothetical protein
MRKLLKIIESIVSIDEEILVPARKIYLTIKYKYDVEIPPFPEFMQILRKSRKFDVIDYAGIPIYDFPENIEKLLMEYGIYGSGPRVKLKSVELTPEVMRKAFLKSYERIRDGINRLIDELSSSSDKINEDIVKLITSFTELREQFDKTIQMLEKLEIYENIGKGVGKR